jgi:hypothetical protein
MLGSDRWVQVPVGRYAVAWPSASQTWPIVDASRVVIRSVPRAGRIGAVLSSARTQPRGMPLRSSSGTSVGMCRMTVVAGTASTWFNSCTIVWVRAIAQ